MFLRDKLYVQRRIRYVYSENTNICSPLSMNLHFHCGSCRELTSVDHSENEFKFDTTKLELISGRLIRDSQSVLSFIAYN